MPPGMLNRIKMLGVERLPRPPCPEGSLDGELGLPEDFLVVNGFQRGELHDRVNKVVALYRG